MFELNSKRTGFAVQLIAFSTLLLSNNIASCVWGQEIGSKNTVALGASGGSESGSDWLDEIAFGEPPEVLSPQYNMPISASENLASPQMVAWLSSLVRSSLPEDYEDSRKWGMQKEVWNGVDFDREGLRIKTHSRRKMVNDGTWTRYRIVAVDPDKHMKIDFRRLEMAPDGLVHFDVSVQLLLDVFGRLSQWVRDVQLISLSANADAVCQASLRGTVEFRWNPLQIPPDIAIKPKVDFAKVELIYFRVKRISQIRGSLAKHLGNGLKEILDDKLEQTNSKLVDKINTQLTKKADKMSFSTQAWLQSKLPLPPSSQN